MLSIMPTTAHWAPFTGSKLRPSRVKHAKVVIGGVLLTALAGLWLLGGLSRLAFSAPAAGRAAGFRLSGLDGNPQGLVRYLARPAELRGLVERTLLEMTAVSGRSLSRAAHEALLLNSHPDRTRLEALVDIITNVKEQEWGAFAVAPTLHGARYLPRSPVPLDRSDRRRLANEETHRDQILSVMGTLGIPLTRCLRVAGRDMTLRALLDDCLAEFHPLQAEIEWTACAIVGYLPPRCEWSNKFGEACSLDQIAVALCERSLGPSSCAGTHVVEALVRLDLADRSSAVLSGLVRRRVRERLSRLADIIASSQRTSGAWGRDWHSDLPSAKHATSSPSEFSAEELLVTGHLLTAVTGWHSDYFRPTIRLDRAGQFLEAQLFIVLRDPAAVRAHFCPITHAVCVIGILEVPLTTKG